MYLISLGLKARVSHIMFSPYPFLCPRSSLQGMEKEQSTSTWNQPSNLEPNAWNPFPDCSPSTALEVPIVSTFYASREDTRCLSEASENDASKHLETSATNTCTDHPLLLQKQKYLISSGSKAKVSHIMFFPYLFICPCSCLQNKEKGSNQSKPEIQRPIRN
ncbi:hypothetical protein COP1_044651 [Malus domestica]